MNRNLNSDPNQTVRRVLPYGFRMRSDGKLVIINTHSQVLVVTHSEVANILKRDDLDVHRRRMYEAALEEFKKTDPKKAVQ